MRRVANYGFVEQPPKKMVTSEPKKIMENESNNSALVELTAEIVSAYVSNNPLQTGDISAVISDVHASLRRIANEENQPEAEPLKPAVSIKKSVTPDFLICLEDGKKFKSLKRHLRTHYDMSPEQYREKWGLPADYPMVAPSYAAARSRLAKEMGLGRKAGSKKR